MSDSSSSKNSFAKRSNLQHELEIDSVCDAFESYWKGGQRPELRDYLSATEFGQETLFVELVLIDVAYRQQQGERPSLAEYESRYPHFGEALQAVTLPVPPQSKTITPIATAPSERRRIGKFELYEIIGEGSFGVVWKAKDLSLERWVALKQFRNEIPNISREMLRREALAVAQVNHVNVVRVHEIGQEGSEDYVAFELVSGGTLEQWIKAQPKTNGLVQITPQVAAEFARQLASGLEAVHREQVVHRDFKPANILLDNDGVLKITDFGLARHSELLATIAGDGILMGTIPYMSPEQICCREITARSDIYSLGVVLYELLTGRRPLSGTSEEIRHKIEAFKPARPGQLADVPAALENICLRALEKIPEDRYQTAGEMEQDLEKYLRGETVALVRPPVLKRVWRGLKRHAAVIAMTLIVVAATATAVLSQFSATAVNDGKLEVEILTEPEGANVVLVGLDPLTGKPRTDLNQYIHPMGKTPLSHRLSPGRYHIVASFTDDGRFAEAVRTVPESSDQLTSPFRYQFWRETGPTSIRWMPIKIPDKSVTDNMILIPGANDVELGRVDSPDAPLHRTSIRPFYVSKREFRPIDLPGKRDTPPKDAEEAAKREQSADVRFDFAVGWSESAGGRLLTEEEFEFLAQMMEAYEKGDTANLDRFSGMTGISTEELVGRLSQIQDLLSGKAEWVWGATTAYRIAANPALSLMLQPHERHDRFQILKGGNPRTYVPHEFDFGERSSVTSADRAIEYYASEGPGYGFRMARSAHQPLQNTDSISHGTLIATSHAPNTGMGLPGQ